MIFSSDFKRAQAAEMPSTPFVISLINPPKVETVNICVIDLTKAYDKVNHNSLFMKLMKRHIPLYTTVGATRELAFGLARLR